MLYMAQQQGITGVIATPHYSSAFPNNDPKRIRQLCRDVEALAYSRLRQKVQIWPGQEILYGENTVELLDTGQLLTMAQSRYVLIEFMPLAPFSYIFGAVRNMILHGYRPVIAHAERYTRLREKGRVQELKDQGAYIQMNYRRIGGKWYDGTTRWCREMLRRRTVDFLGTDMHNISSRRPETKEAMEWMDRHLKRDYISAITHLNQRKVLSDEKI